MLFSAHVGVVSDIAVFVLKRDVKLQLTHFERGNKIWSQLCILYLRFYGECTEFQFESVFPSLIKCSDWQ